MNAIEATPLPPSSPAVAPPSTTAPPSPTVTVPAEWPKSAATLRPDQIEAYKEAIATFNAAAKILNATWADPKATTLPDEIYKYADPEGAWIESEKNLLTEFREVGGKRTGNAKYVVEPRTGSVWNPNALRLYVCADGRSATFYKNGQNYGPGRIVHATLRAELSSTGWRITGYEPGREGDYAETNQCGQDGL